MVDAKHLLDLGSQLRMGSFDVNVNGFPPGVEFS